MGVVPGLDERVEALMSAVRLDSEQALESWRTALAQACPADRTVDEFATALRGAPGDVSSESVEQFVRTLASFGDGIAPVTDLVATLEREPDLYWQLYHQLYSGQQGTEPAADRFGWLSQAQVERLGAGWGDQWREYLGQQLDYRWGAGWEATYATEGRQGYLDALIEEWLPSQPGAPARASIDQLSPEDTTRLIDAAIADAVKNIPGADELTEAELAEVAAAVRAQTAGSVR
ncbi:MAG TPA: hypothetical protein VFW65_10460 [Pseudonocardiaceae bacterium]|nr:hypothetical protein [Pseudonocardiaceae bacterium]